jgi:hypothetical protein
MERVEHRPLRGPAEARWLTVLSLDGADKNRKITAPLQEVAPRGDQPRLVKLASRIRIRSCAVLTTLVGTE